MESSTKDKAIDITALRDELIKLFTFSYFFLTVIYIADSSAYYQRFNIYISDYIEIQEYFTLHITEALTNSFVFVFFVFVSIPLRHHLIKAMDDFRRFSPKQIVIVFIMLIISLFVLVMIRNHYMDVPKPIKVIAFDVIIAGILYFTACYLVPMINNLITYPLSIIYTIFSIYFLFILFIYVSKAIEEYYTNKNYL